MKGLNSQLTVRTRPQDRLMLALSCDIRTSRSSRSHLVECKECRSHRDSTRLHKQIFANGPTFKDDNSITWYAIISICTL